MAPLLGAERMTVKVTVKDRKRGEKTGKERTGTIPRIVRFYRGKRGKQVVELTGIEPATS
jgi:hypothetical protein